MASSYQDYQLNDNGVCLSCDVLSTVQDFVQCAICDKKFHAICASCPADERWATKSTIHTMKAASTKRNFKFMCNQCSTIFEKNKADGEGIRMHKMEQNMEQISKELQEIKKLVMMKSSESPANEVIPPPWHATQSLNNLWFNTEKLSSVKAKPAESILVINKDDDVNIDKTNTTMVENSIIEGKISVQKSYKNKNGNLVVVCDSVQSRDQLKTHVSASNENIEMKTPKEKRPVISIVGFSKNYEHQEVIDLLVQQNYFLKQFSTVNSISDQISVFSVKTHLR